MTQNIPYHIHFRHLIISFIKISLLIIILWFVGKSLYKSIANVDWSTVVFQPIKILAGSLIIMTAFFVGTWGVRYIYKHLDAISLSWTQAFILLTLPPVGKYLPSKFFALAGHAAIAKTFGIRIIVSGGVTFLIMGLGLASATLIGLLLLLFQVPIAESQRVFQGGTAGMIIIIMVLILHPNIYWRMMNLALRFLNQPPIIVKMRLQTMAILFIALLFQNGLYLFGVSVIASGTVALPVSMLPALVGVTCLANVAGFVAIFAPAGIGVREGIFLVMLTPLVGTGIAGLIAVMMRLIQTIADAILGLTGFVTLHFLRNKNDNIKINILNIKSENYYEKKL